MKVSEPIRPRSVYKHLKEGRCPFCNNADTTFERTEKADVLLEMEQVGKCNICDRKWIDSFVYTETREIVEDNDGDSSAEPDNDTTG